MDDTGGKPYRVGYVGADAEAAEWVQAGFDRADESVDFVTERTVAAALERVETAQHPPDPRLRTPLADTESAFDAFVVADDGDWGPAAVAERIRNRDSDLPVVLFVDDGSEGLAARAVEADANGYVTTDSEDPTSELAATVIDRAETARRRRANHREQELASRLVERNPEVVTVVRPGADLAFQNGRVADVLGFDPAEVKGRLPYERIHDADWQALREAFYDAVMDPEYVPTVEFRVRDDDGTWRTVEARGRNLLSDPVVRGFVVTIRDVSERRAREREHERYRQIVENVGDAMFLLDPDGYFEWVNDAFVERTGYERKFIEGVHASVFLSEEDFQRMADGLLELRENGGSGWRRFEFVAENVESDIREFEARISPLTDGDGEVQGTVGIVRSMTEAF